MDPFDLFSPVDFRYEVPELGPYLWESAFTAYKLKVELALVKALHKRGFCSADAVAEVDAARAKVTAADVYEEEKKKTKHDIRALVNCVKRHVSEGVKPFVHMMATSYDIVDTANAARIKDAVTAVVLPALKRLILVLAELTEREAHTPQIGRTHGQHGVPITFGFALARDLSRLGWSMLEIDCLGKQLPGKFSGAVGAYNASSLFVNDPEGLEAEILAEMGLIALEHSTQIVQPEELMRLLHEMMLCAGIMANLATDMRNLQRTEIAEVGELFEEGQVGSSTMAHKQNPIGFENIVSIWKIIVGRMMTVAIDQISEHQRDLTGSASSRTLVEVIVYLTYMIKRLTGLLQKLQVDRDRMMQNLLMKAGLIVAEPLYLLLASLGHSTAHEKGVVLSAIARKEGKSLGQLAEEDTELKVYLDRMKPGQKAILSDPLLYKGRAADRALIVARHWMREVQ